MSQTILGADAINALAATVQAQVVEGLGFRQLAEPRKVEAAA